MARGHWSPARERVNWNPWTIAGGCLCSMDSPVLRCRSRTPLSSTEDANVTPERIEPSPGQESVWDYPRPPRLENCDKHIRVIADGVTIADSRNTKRVLETSHPPTYYIPPEDVLDGWLVASTQRSSCEWKGTARYFSIKMGELVIPDAAWCYPNPIPPFFPIRNHLAFYAELVEACFVGDEQVIPQPGNFYGGWITSGIVGPFKGDAGTNHW